MRGSVEDRIRGALMLALRDDLGMDLAEELAAREAERIAPVVRMIQRACAEAQTLPHP